MNRQIITRYSHAVLQALSVFFCFVAFAIAATPALAVSQVVTQNYTGDTQGNYARLNLDDPNSLRVPGNQQAGIGVTLPVPNPTGTSKAIKVNGISLKMHDHGESMEFTIGIWKDGQFVKDAFAGRADIDTSGTDATCGEDGGFVKYFHDHHLPENDSQDRHCMGDHTFDLGGVEADTIVLAIFCRTEVCYHGEAHTHIGDITWWLDVPEDDPEEPEPEPIPVPNLEVLGCVNDTTALYSIDLLRVSWPTPEIPIVDVAITDSTASNPWNGANARYWNKKTPGVTSTTGPAGFIPRTANTGTLIFQPNKTYRVVLWDGTRLSEERSVTFEACPEQPRPATASLLAQCSNRAATAPLVFNYDLRNINLQGGEFRKAVYYLRVPNNTSTAAVRNYLGRPNWSDRDGAYAYWLGQTFTAPTGNSLQYRWTQGTAIGSSVGNRRTLANLEAWYKARGESGSFQAAVSIETTFNGAVVQSTPAATAPITVSAQACVTGDGDPNDPICIPDCGSATCSVAGASDGCDGVCPAGTGIGQPNTVQILSPQAGTPIALNQSKQFDLTWRQQPTNNAAASLVTQYAGAIYKQGSYATPTAAFDAGFLGATDVIIFTVPAAQGNTAAIYSRRITLAGSLLQGPLTIAIQSRNLQCPAQNLTQQNSAWEEEPHPISAEISGKFYLIPPGGSCTPSASNLISFPSAQVTATALDGTTYNGNFSGTDGFSFAVPAQSTSYGYQLSFSDGTGQLRCADSCHPGSGPTTCAIGNKPGPSNNAHFYVTRFDTSKGPWWQTLGGLIYGHTGVRSDLPNVDPALEQFLSDVLPGGSNETSGVPLTNGGFNTELSGWFNKLSGNPHAAGTNNKDFVTRENYAFFVERLEAPLPSDDFGGTTVTDIGGIPSGDAYKDARVAYRDGDLRLDFGNGPLLVKAGQKRVIFVSGNLTVTQRDPNVKVTEVEPGGFLAFVVKGNITFEQSVGHENPGEGLEIPDQTPVVEGVFIADGALTVASRTQQDAKFVGAGTFVGWSGVNLPRTFENSDIGAASHLTTPTDTFVFRPDFLLSAPDIFKYSDYVWQEIR